MADRRNQSDKSPEVGNPHRQGGVADQGGFEDQYGSKKTGGGMGLGGPAADGVANGAVSEAELMTNHSGRPIEDEAAFDEKNDLHPGRASDRPIRVKSDDEE